MTTLALKLLACLTMLIDHTAVTLWVTGRMTNYYILYRVLRGIGRVAFPIFCFQVVQGAMHTSNKLKYALRLLLFGLISEVPFDVALFAYRLIPSKGFFYWGYQNVYFTLLLGLLCVYVLQWGSRLEGKKKILGWGLFLLTTALCMTVAENLVLSDYGSGGVAQIAVMGLLSAPFEKVRFRLASERFFNLFICAFAIGVLIMLTNSAEIYALFALIPIYFYNGKQGVASSAGRKLFYAFYPAHLALLAAVFVLPLYFK